MPQSIWDLKQNSQFINIDGVHCQVVTPTIDGKGLVAKYIQGALKGSEDFVFEPEIKFNKH
jgi:hypothetical protein